MLGIKRKTLAQDYGISEIRVHQIIAAGRKADLNNSKEILNDWDEQGL
jgi:DNA-binding transcriptional regulator LsrR (DeoR family)